MLASLVCEGAICAPPAPEIRLVAAAGQTAPGSSRVFGTFIDSPPSVNIHGDVVFRANYVHQGPEGIWAERGAAGLQPVAINGQTAPGVPNWNFEFFGSSNPGINASTGALVINNSGQVAFRATVGGVGNFKRDGLWLAQPSGALEYIAPTGGPVASGSMNDFQIEHENLTLNQQGTVTFRGWFTQPNVSPYATVWTYSSPHPPKYIGGTFDPVPEDPTRKFNSFAFVGAMTDAAGRTFFNASPGSDTGTYIGQNGLYVSEAGLIRSLVKDWDDVPGLSGVKLNSFYPFDPAINSHGQYAFASGLTGTGVNSNNNVAIFRGSADGAFQAVLREGDQAPGMPAGIVFADLSSPEINAQGRIALLATVRGPGVNNSNNEMVWAESASGEFTPVAREGQLAPDSPGGAFGPLFSNSVFNNLAINARGQVAFHSNFFGATSGDGIWATDPAGTLKSIVLSGVPFEASNGELHTISGLVFAGRTGNDEGRPSGFSDAGHVAFTALGGSHNAGIYVSSKVLRVPEPCTFALVGMTMLFGAVVRCRRQLQGKCE